MRTNILIAAAALMTCFTLSGCNDSSKNDESAALQSNNGSVVALNIHEYGGEDGRLIDWEVYRESDNFYLSFSDQNGSLYYLANDSSFGKPNSEVFEITRQEYDDIMSLDYEKIISEYDENEAEDKVDWVYYQATITYENGAEISTEANMTEAVVKFIELIIEHKS